MAGPPLSPEELGAELGLPRPTLDRLAVHLDLLRRWQRAINLVGRSTLADPWRRHVLDSAQLYAHLAGRPLGPLVDLGSGAGFPGLVLAILGAPDVHLIESDRRKAQFLREAARATGAPVTIHPQRIEEVPPFPAATVTARALAPLPKLLDYAEPFLGPDTVCLFLKGASAVDELKNVCHTWQTSTEALPSRADPSGVVLKLTRVRRVRHG